MENLSPLETFSPEHREKYSDTLQQLESLYFKRILKKIRREFLDTSLSLSYIMLKKIGKTELERWSNNLFVCNCCDRHQHKKKLIVNNEVKVVTRNVLIPTTRQESCNLERSSCMCDCRHLGRMLSRIIPHG